MLFSAKGCVGAAEPGRPSDALVARLMGGSLNAVNPCLYCLSSASAAACASFSAAFAAREFVLARSRRSRARTLILSRMARDDDGLEFAAVSANDGASDPTDRMESAESGLFVAVLFCLVVRDGAGLVMGRALLGRYVTRDA